MTEIKKYKMLINGNWTSGSENKFFESLNTIKVTAQRSNSVEKLGNFRFFCIFSNMLI